MSQVKDTGSHVRLEMFEMSSLIGKILTIVDASISDKEQRKAVKDLVKQTMWDWSKEYHFAATEEQLQNIVENSEDALEGDEAPTIPHYDD